MTKPTPPVRLTLTDDLRRQLDLNVIRHGDTTLPDLIRWYVHKGIERDGMGPDDLDNLRIMFEDVLDLHRATTPDKLECLECRVPYPCPTRRILTEPRDTWHDEFRGVWGSWATKAER